MKGWSSRSLTAREPALRLLWEAARILLTSDDADAIIPGLLYKVGHHLEPDTLNYMVDETGKVLRLEPFSGISGIQVREVRRLEFGQGVAEPSR